MKIARELPGNLNLIRSYDAHSLRVGEHVVRRSCLISATQLVQDWAPRDLAELVPDHFQAAFDWQPEIIVLGSNASQPFPSRAVSAAIMSRGIGFEAMQLGAACRTYNVLLSENRRAVLGIILA